MPATPGWGHPGVDPETERLGKVPRQVRVPEDVAEHFRQLEVQSAGGGDEPDNTITAGDFCHLEAIHEHHSIRLEPPASKPTWKLGRNRTLFVVQGRQKRALS